MDETLHNNLESKEAPILITPSIHVKDSFISALKEFQEENRYTNLKPEELEEDFQIYVEKLKTKAVHPEEGKVPESVFWLTEGDTYIGRVSIRHSLNEYLLREGGHIGYDIRPSERQKGYGRMILELALPEAKKLGIEKILVTCDSTNVGSKKIIESHGGILENEVPASEPGEPSILRFWIG